MRQVARLTGAAFIAFGAGCADLTLEQQDIFDRGQSAFDAQRWENAEAAFTQIIDACPDYAPAYGMGYVSLRYFNAAGADPEGALGEDHSPESHLIPIVLQVPLGQREKVSVFGGRSGSVTATVPAVVWFSAASRVDVVICGGSFSSVTVTKMVWVSVPPWPSETCTCTS